MKKLKKFLIWLVGIIVLLVGLLYITDYDYILKGIRVVYLTGHDTAFIDDHPYFENEVMPASTMPEPWPMHKNYNQVVPTKKLVETNDNNGTVAFLIIKNDSIWHEFYAEGYGVDSQTNSFSMAKSVTSALLGKAIDDGYIKSLDQPVGDFYEQYQGSKLTVGDLASMASGLDWDESYKNPFGVTAKANYDDDVAETILDQKVIETPGVAYKYLSGNTQLLGMVIEQATGKKLANYLSESFWQPMGFEKDGLWQVDDAENRLVKAFCCIGSNARDFARFGKLYKNHGKWKGQQILDSSFVDLSIRPRFAESDHYGYGFWLSNHLDKKLFSMHGMLGQYVIGSREDDVLIVRLGHHRGEKKINHFHEDFYVYVEEAYKMLDAN